MVCIAQGQQTCRHALHCESQCKAQDIYYTRRNSLLLQVVVRLIVMLNLRVQVLTSYISSSGNKCLQKASLK